MASAVRIAANRKIVSQPAKVISELLPTDQRVEEVGDHEHGDDQAEEVGAAHVRDEEAGRQLDAHIRSTPSTIHSSRRNTTIPSAIAKMSMAVTIDGRVSRTHDDRGDAHNDFVTTALGDPTRP